MSKMYVILRQRRILAMSSLELATNFNFLRVPVEFGGNVTGKCFLAENGRNLI